MNIHRLNPDTIVIAAEATSCKGCGYEQTVRFKDGEIRVMCNTGRKHGTRCKRYRQTNRGRNG